MRARTPFSLSAVQINGCIRSNMTTTAAMRVWTFVGTFLAFNSAASGLMCYKCSEMARPPSNRTETTPPCSRFDPYAPEFQVECADSTFCMKKTFELVLQNGQTVKGESRGCAPQSYNYHSYSEGVGWTVKTAVEETAYEDGCTRDTANPSGVKAPSTEHCYCARHLCNSAASTVARRGEAVEVAKRSRRVGEGRAWGAGWSRRGGGQGRWWGRPWRQRHTTPTPWPSSSSSTQSSTFAVYAEKIFINKEKISNASMKKQCLFKVEKKCYWFE